MTPVMAENSRQEKTLRGIGASPGICIGKAYLVDTEGVDVVGKYFIHRDHLNEEITRFKTAVQQALDDMKKIIEDTPAELREQSDILETHSILLKDKMLYDRTIDTIRREAINAEWALKKVVSSLKRMFREMANGYLQARADDISQVSDRILRNLVGAPTVSIAAIDKRVILVAHDLSPAETSQIHLERIMGFITDRGARTSHTSIIARTLEIPAVTGLGNASKIIHNDDLIIVDGNAGIVIIHPTEQTLVKYEEKKMGYQRYRAALSKNAHLPARTRDGRLMTVMANIELPEEVVPAIDHGADGIGLYRTEFQYMGAGMFPDEEQLFDKYRDVVEVMNPRPVTIRTLDINGDKTVGERDECGEPNPALGMRAIRYCLKNPEVFQTQLRAILRAALHGNVRIIFPMIACLAELRQARAALRQAAKALGSEGAKALANLKVGIMIEVPAAVIMADHMAREVDFFSIGTNDLVQYTMAIDRDNRDLVHLNQPLAPPILRMIKCTVDQAKKHGIGIYMCGEMAADPLHAPVLLGLGLDELSMNPQSIPMVKNMIRSMDEEEARSAVAEIMNQASLDEVTEVLKRRFADLLPEAFNGGVDATAAHPDEKEQTP